MYLFLDFDETLVESIDACLDILNKMYNTNYSKNDVTTWNFSNIFSDLNDEKVECLFRSRDFFDVLKFKNGAKELLSDPKWEHKIFVVTKGTTENLKLKKEWFVSQGFKHIPMILLPTNVSKKVIDMSDGILVDDHQDNLNETNAKVKILFENVKNAEWNDKYSGLKIGSFKDLNYILDNFIRE